MSGLKRLLGLLGFAGLTILYCMPSSAQVYSYIDENGVRVITNIPPNGPVNNLRITGTPPPVPIPAPASVLFAKSAKGPAIGQQKVQEPLQKRAKATQRTAKSTSPADYDAIIQKYAEEYRLDPDLIRSMITTESGYNQDAVSPKGAQGLMQLMPQTASRLGVQDPFDPEQNIWGGAKYMRYLLDSFADSPDSLPLSLAAYNAGENLVQRLGRIPSIRETSDYVRMVLQQYGKDQMVLPAPRQPAVPQLYDFVDESGVRNLTNIPPVNRAPVIIIQSSSKDRQTR